MFASLDVSFEVAIIDSLLTMKCCIIDKNKYAFGVSLLTITFFTHLFTDITD